MSVEGLKELDAGLAELPKATAKAVLRRVGTKALEPMLAEARRLAPDDPNTPDPDLESSIQISSRQKSGRQVQRTKEGPSTVQLFMGPTKEGYPQAIPQEFGAVQHPPHPFMRPAFEAHKVGAIESIARDLGGEIEKSRKRIAARTARLAVKTGR